MDKKVIDYAIVRGLYRPEFEENMRTMIKDGWQPFQNFVISLSLESWRGYHQAVVKYED